MKIDRLIGILSILLQKEQITAPELASRFEVSRRTINRDIEDLCNAGIPISTVQGFGGGIRIMDGYKMDRTILTSKDMRMILAGLRSLDSVSGSEYCSQLMEKVKAGSTNVISGSESVLIDLAAWYKDSLSQKIELIQSAIEGKRVISFHYYSPSGESIREIEPYYLIFKWGSWYVWGWCILRNDFRMFKLNRLESLELTLKNVIQKDVPLPDLSQEQVFSDEIHVKALFETTTKWKLIEEFGPHCFKEQEDGRLLFEEDYTNSEYLIAWLMSFGAKVEVLQPIEIKQAILENAKRMIETYEKRKENGDALYVGR